MTFALTMRCKKDRPCDVERCILVEAIVTLCLIELLVPRAPGTVQLCTMAIQMGEPSSQAVHTVKPSCVKI
jgi:hypothetical protein